MAQWIEVPEGLPVERHAGLLTARLTSATGVFAPNYEERPRTRKIAEKLLED